MDLYAAHSARPCCALRRQKSHATWERRASTPVSRSRRGKASKVLRGSEPMHAEHADGTWEAAHRGSPGPALTAAQGTTSRPQAHPRVPRASAVIRVSILSLPQTARCRGKCRHARQHPMSSGERARKWWRAAPVRAPTAEPHAPAAIGQRLLLCRRPHDAAERAAAHGNTPYPAVQRARKWVARRAGPFADSRTSCGSSHRSAALALPQTARCRGQCRRTRQHPMPSGATRPEQAARRTGPNAEGRTSCTVKGRHLDEVSRGPWRGYASLELLPTTFKRRPLLLRRTTSDTVSPNAQRDACVTSRRR